MVIKWAAGILTAAVLLVAAIAAGGATMAGAACQAPTDASTIVHDDDIADTFLRVAMATGASERATVALFAAGLVESNMTTGPTVRNIDRDSAGPLQQRPSMGWGTVPQVEDPAYAARAFLLGPQRAGSAAGGNREPGAIARDRTWAGTVGELAQAVQRSAFPDRYDDRVAQARSLIARYSTGNPPATPRPASPAAPETNDTGAWGGHSNGHIPASAMDEIEPGHRLRADAAAAWIALQQQARADLGAPVGVTDSYRDYATQVVTKATKGALAATPGTSNHGWGMALDLVVGGFGTRTYQWLTANGPRYGWVNPDWAHDGSGIEEPWHWEFHGDAEFTAPIGC